MKKTIIELVEKAISKAPDKIAFVDENRSYTYKELQNKSYSISSCIIKKGVINSPVAVYMEKNIDCISSFVGVACSRNYYVVLDVDAPEERNRLIIQDICPSLVICNKSYHEKALRLFQSVDVVLVEDVGENVECNTEIEQICSEMTGSETLYVMYTSGSTGKPKGVITTHQAVVEYAESATKAYGIRDDDVFGNQYPFSSVASVEDIYLTIFNMAQMVIIPSYYYKFPAKLIACLCKRQVTTINWVPSAMTLLVMYGGLEKLTESKLRKVIFGGETIPYTTLCAWMRSFPKAEFINGYGSTEVTAGGTLYYVKSSDDFEKEVPIGQGFPHVKGFIVDENNEIIEGNGEGELCISSSSLAEGYWGDNELTEKRFITIDDCHGTKIRAYKTGDIVNTYDGLTFYYIGRKDYQVKKNGYRVELGEIENCANSIIGVIESGCIWDNDEKKISLFYCGDISEKSLFKRLNETLPQYMIPDEIVKLKELPKNNNGKIDREELKKKNEKKYRE